MNDNNALVVWRHPETEVVRMRHRLRWVEVRYSQPQFARDYRDEDGELIPLKGICCEVFGWLEGVQEFVL